MAITHRDETVARFEIIDGRGRRRFVALLIVGLVACFAAGCEAEVERRPVEEPPAAEPEPDPEADAAAEPEPEPDPEADAAAEPEPDAGAEPDPASDARCPARGAEGEACPVEDAWCDYPRGECPCGDPADHFSCQDGALVFEGADHHCEYDADECNGPDCAGGPGGACGSEGESCWFAEGITDENDFEIYRRFQCDGGVLVATDETHSNGG